MTPTYFQELYDYNFWNNQRLRESVSALSAEQITQPNSYSRGPILNQCFHVMGVEWWWTHFLRTGELAFLDADDFPTWESVDEKWVEIEAYVRSYLAELTAADLQRMVKPDFWDDDEPVAVYQALTQVAFHSADHRSQILTQVHLLGGGTFEQDFLIYLDERGETV